MDYLKKCLLAVSKDCRNHRYGELYNNKTNGPWNAMAFKILAFACDHEESEYGSPFIRAYGLFLASYEMLKCLGNPMTTRNLLKYSNALSEYFRFYWTGPDHSFLE